MLKLKLSDISQEKGDFVVNPSNTILSLGSGVSGVLKRMCPTLQTQMNKYIQEKGYLNPGEIAITPYPCNEFNYAIHAAVMDYRSNATKINPDYQRIETICKNISSFLKDKEYLVITPLLGTGVGGLDKKKVFEIMKNNFENLKAEVILVVHQKLDFELLSNL